MSFNFMATVTICSDFEDQENRVCHCFHYFPHLFAMMEKEMVTHSSILAWRFPRTDELGGLQSMGSQESDLTNTAHTICHEVVGLDAMILVF